MVSWTLGAGAGFGGWDWAVLGAYFALLVTTGAVL